MSREELVEDPAASKELSSKPFYSAAMAILFVFLTVQFGVLGVAARAHRHDAVAGRLRRSGHAQHAWHARAVDIGIQHTDLGSLCRKRQRQIGCGGRLAHTTLARRNRDDSRPTTGSRNRDLALLTAPYVAHQGRPLLVGHRCEVDDNVRDAGDRLGGHGR